MVLSPSIVLHCGLQTLEILSTCAILNESILAMELRGQCRSQTPSALPTQEMA